MPGVLALVDSGSVPLCDKIENTEVVLHFQNSKYDANCAGDHGVWVWPAHSAKTAKRKGI
jgi:hypothetical protein